jgi:hypothetical protein
VKRPFSAAVGPLATFVAGAFAAAFAFGLAAGFVAIFLGVAFFAVARLAGFAIGAFSYNRMCTDNQHTDYSSGPKQLEIVNKILQLLVNI